MRTGEVRVERERLAAMLDGFLGAAGVGIRAALDEAELGGASSRTFAPTRAASSPADFA